VRPRSLPALTLAVLISACGDTTQPLVPSDLQLSHQTVQLDHGEQVTVTATLVDQHGNAFTTPPQDFTINWSSSTPDVASVADGVIVARAPGTAVITARSGSLPERRVEVQVTTSMQIGFSYTGEREGSFSISRTLVDLEDPEEVAVSYYDSEHGMQTIVAMRFRSDARIDMLLIAVDGRVQAPGAMSIGMGQAFLFLGLPFFGSEMDAEGMYASAGGTLSVSQASATRIAGTFSMNMVNVETMSALNVTGGTFNLPVFEEDVLDDMGAAAAPATLWIEPLLGALRD
jgi:hypothetical protein